MSAGEFFELEARTSTDSLRTETSRWTTKLDVSLPCQAAMRIELDTVQ